MSGRHRRETAGRQATSRGTTSRRTTGRHRAPHGLLATGRGRTVVLGSALGGALLTGVAGHPAAPAAAAVAGPARIATAVAAWAPPAAPGTIDRLDDVTAVAALRKQRPASAAAWVNPNPAATVTSCFGPRWGREHQGLDMAAPLETPIVAAGAGNVVRAGPEGGYGNAVLVDHGNGYLTHYGHLSAITVAAGQRVATGDRIGLEGSTGHSTGPHLHFEVHQGAYPHPVEPTRWMHERGVDIAGCETF
jgi:murein DD-endopeptidase MepM/ murein hydrolase activator NlpD